MTAKPTTPNTPSSSAATPSQGPEPATGKTPPAASDAGEEDPGAALDDPAMRDAMRSEASESEHKIDAKLREQQQQEAVRKSPGGDRR